ncbi:MAG: tetratricopeptide repeat protein [Draconibacterium sp.]
MNNTLKLWFLLFLFYLLIISPAAYGQSISNTKIDSLRMVVEKKSGNDKIAAELDLALQLLNTDKDEALQLATAVLPESKAIADRKLNMRSFYVLGRVYADLDNSKLSLAYLDSALLIAETTGDNWNKGEILYHIGLRKHQLGEVIQALEAFNASIQASRLSDNFRFSGSSYSLMGTIFRMNGLYDRAIEYIIKAELYYEKAGFTEGSAWANYLLGRIYYDLKLPEIALRYFQQSLEIYLRLAAIDGIKNGVAICYEQIGTLYIESGNFDEARECFSKTMEIYTESESKYGISNVYKNLGILEYSIGNYQLAEKHLNKSLEIKKEVNDKLSSPVIYEYLGLSMIARGLKQEGFSYLQKALDLAITNNQKKIQLDILSKLTEAWLSVNDLKKAIDYQNQQIQIQNLILSGAANIKTEQLQTIYEIDQKNSQIAELEKQNKISTLSIKQQRMIRNIMIAGIILAISISVIIYWFNKKLQLKNLELYETNATKDKFFAIIAHDLRGPTSSLSSLLEHLSSKFDEISVTELKSMLQVLHKSAENVSNLLENLLIWARSHVNRIEYRPAVLNLAEVLQNSLRGLSQTADKKQIELKVNCAGQIFVLADPDMVQTIVRNILGNAIKFTHRGGEVTITTAVTDKNMVMVSIIDNGVGIEKSKLSKIFDIDSSSHTQGTEKEMSTGLGLILVKEFVLKNKGTLTIDSEKDKGTTVSFTLPLTQEPIIASSVHQA